LNASVDVDVLGCAHRLDTVPETGGEHGQPWLLLAESH
jgi:hypothetical protein